MHFKKYIFLFFVVLSSGSLCAQDFHYTQYFMSPLGVNPAQAGAYSGSYRINGIYRDQYRGSASEPFGGFSLNVDAPIIKGLRDRDWVGVGLRLEQATAGSIGQKMNFYGLGAAYHLGLNKKQTSYMSLGAQYGTGSINYDRLDLDDTALGLTSNTFSSRAMGFNNMADGTGVTGGSLNDLSIGLLYSNFNPKSGSIFRAGFSVEGILSPNRAALRSNDKKGLGLNVHTSYDFLLNKKTSLTSGAYYYSLDKNNAWNVNSILNYKLKPENEMTLHGGLGTRSFRAVLIYIGATFKGVRVGLGYDLDIGNSVTATNNHKSIELGVTYIGKIYKKPKVKPIIYCPRL